MMTSLATSGALAVLPGAVAVSGGGGGAEPVVTEGIYQVTNRVYIPNAVSANRASKNRTYHVLMTPMRYIKFGFWSACIDVSGSAGGTVNSGDVTRHCVVEIDGQLKEVTWNGGAGTGTILAGQFGFTDLLDLGAVYPAGTPIYLRQYVTTPSGTLPYTTAGGALSGTFSVMHTEQNIGHATTLTDDINTTPAGSAIPGTNTNTTANLYPQLIVGTTTKPSFLIGFGGNSRDQGNDDAPNTTKGDVGNMARCVGEAGYAYVNASCSSQRLDYALFNPYIYKFLARYVSHVFVGDFGNDTKVTSNLLQPRQAGFMQDATQDAAACFPGKVLILQDSAPIVTGTYTTEGGQTMDTGNTQVALHNDYVYTTPSPYSAHVDTCAFYESTTTRGKWRAATPALTGDGIHPTQAAYTAFAASGTINVAALAALQPVAQNYSPHNRLLISGTDFAVWVDAENRRSNYNDSGGTAGTIYSKLSTSTYTQGTVGKQATPATAAQINSAPAWVLQKASAKGWAGSTGAKSIANGKSGHTAFFLFQRDTIATVGEYFQYVTTNNDTSQRIATGPSNGTTINNAFLGTKRADGDAAYLIVASDATPVGVPVLQVFHIDLVAGTLMIRQNGKTVATGTIPYGGVTVWEASTPDYGSLGVGGSTLTAGPGDYDLKEYFGYGGALSQADIERVESYFAHQTAANLLPQMDAAHPYKVTPAAAVPLAAGA